MEETLNISFDVHISPADIDNLHFKQYIKENFQETIYNGKYISEIKKIINLEYGKILSNGYINVQIQTESIVFDLKIGKVYKNITVTKNNKLGAFIKLNKINIYIPKEYCINDVIPNVGNIITINIIGKRVEDNVSCIAKQVE